MDSDALPLNHATVVHALQDAASVRAQAGALRCGHETLTYEAYWRCALGCAAELRTHLAAGARVALLMDNSLDMAVALMGVQLAGMQVAALNPGYTQHELEPILADADVGVLLIDQGHLTMHAGAPWLKQVKHVLAVGQDQRLIRWRDDADIRLTWDLPRPEGISTLQYTGGTTGRSKGVELSHQAVAINVRQRQALLPVAMDSERVLAVTPLFHVYATSMGLYLALFARAELIIIPRYRPEEVLKTIQEQQITLFAGSPTLFHGLMAHLDFPNTNWSSLKLCFSGSAPLPVETLRRWEAVTGCPICEGYGQTEAGPVATFNPAQGLRKPGTVGVAVPLTQVQIVDTETGDRCLDPGEAGEIRLRGPQLMNAYRNRPNETAHALRQGWLYTGDIGCMDADGYLTITDRKKDMVIVGGYNVYPREVEEVLHQHPEVLEAAVVGLPDPYRGEQLCAFVVSKSQDAEQFITALHAWCTQRLVKYKRPIEIRCVSSLPKTSVGKIDKPRLRSDGTAGA